MGLVHITVRLAIIALVTAQILPLGRCIGVAAGLLKHVNGIEQIESTLLALVRVLTQVHHVDLSVLELASKPATQSHRH